MFRNWVAKRAREMYGSANAAGNELSIDKNRIREYSKLFES